MRQRMNTNMMIVMDPPEHDRLRKIVRTVFTKKAVEDLEPLVSRSMGRFLDGLLGRDTFDVVADFAALFPVEVISAMLGIPEGERQQIRLWTDEFLHREPNNPQITHEGLVASLAMHEYMLNLARAKRKSPDGLIVSRLIDATYSDDDGAPRSMSDDDIASFCLVLAAAGSETVTKLIGNGVVAAYRTRAVGADLPGPEADPRRGRRNAPAAAALAIPGAVHYARRDPARCHDPRGARRRCSSPARPPVTRGPTSPGRLRHRPCASTTVVFGPGVRTAASAPGSPGWRGGRAFEEIRSRWPGFAVDMAGTAPGHYVQRGRLLARPAAGRPVSAAPATVPGIARSAARPRGRRFPDHRLRTADVP